MQAPAAPHEALKGVVPHLVRLLLLAGVVAVAEMELKALADQAHPVAAVAVLTQHSPAARVIHLLYHQQKVITVAITLALMAIK